MGVYIHVKTTDPHEWRHRDSRQRRDAQRHTNGWVKTRGAGVFQVHFMLDSLTQESDKDPGLLFLHNFKKKRKRKKVTNHPHGHIWQT